MTRLSCLPALLSAAILLTGAPSFAQDSSAHHGHTATAATAANSNDLYASSRDAMHKGMDVKPSGNADIDFIRNMIPHHQGAVEMAKVQLEHGKDPVLRKLAQDIITAQEAEIKLMSDKLKELEKK